MATDFLARNGRARHAPLPSCPSGGGWRGRPIIDRCKVVSKATTGAHTPPLDPPFGWASNSDVFHTHLCAAVKRAATGFYWSTSGIQPEDKLLCLLCNAVSKIRRHVRARSVVGAEQRPTETLRTTSGRVSAALGLIESSPLMEVGTLAWLGSRLHYTAWAAVVARRGANDSTANGPG
ncbi:hypothetical protein I4F81_005462 [Pyropia yezoensis]|uniref:Uncharacterized protein n=1 Tax=Pyropia yezoensis TaxID=2788 RepID=A0ACC3BYS0_PYRYE|nr:hypothetical protein I4F81_005462 [Neopyropia yezoensis]